MNLQSLRNSLLPPCPVLDIHVHPVACFGPSAVKSAKEDAQRLIKSAKRCGISRMVLFSLHDSTPYDPEPWMCRAANDYALAMRDAAPDVIIPFCYVTPADPQAAVLEIGRCIDQEGMAGIKLWVARKASDPGIDPIMESAIAHDVPVLQHAWLKSTGNLVGESTPQDVAELAKKYPRSRIIMAHLNGAGLRGLESLVSVPNVVVDTSGGDPESGMIEAAVARLGPDRVVYGSDAPIRHFGVTMAKTLGANLPEETKRAILWDNAVRILPGWAL